MTKEELIQNMVDILEDKGGHCLASELLKALQAIDSTVISSQMNDVINENPTVFQRTPTVKTGGGVIESEIKLASVVPMPESKNKQLDRQTSYWKSGIAVKSE